MKRSPGELGLTAKIIGVVVFLGLFLGAIYLMVRFIHWAWIG